VTPPLNPRIARAVAHWEEAWRERFQERASLIEFDGGLPRAEAEERAAAEVGVERARAGRKAKG